MVYMRGGLVATTHGNTALPQAGLMSLSRFALLTAESSPHFVHSALESS